MKNDNDSGTMALNLLPGKTFPVVHLSYCTPARSQPSGEIVVGQAADAKQLIFYTETPDQLCQYVSGTLVCTNYRLSFIPASGAVEKVRGRRRLDVCGEGRE